MPSPTEPGPHHSTTVVRGRRLAEDDGHGNPIGKNTARTASQTRRLKKREVDRKCQRMARDRTKAHIAHLEKLVEEFQKQDEPGHVSALMTKLTQVQKERDELARTVSNIARLAYRPRIEAGTDDETESAVVKYDSSSDGRDGPSTSLDRRFRPVTPPHSSGKNSVGDGSHQPLALDMISYDEQLYSHDTYFQEDIPIPITTSMPQSTTLQLEPQTDIWTDPLMETPSDPGVFQGDSNFMFPAGMSSNQACQLWPTRFDHAPVNNLTARENLPAWDPITPKNSTPCECQSEIIPNTSAYPRLNLWRFANTVLTHTTTPAARAEIVASPSSLDEHISVLAVICGWESVTHLVTQTPTWQVLRQIDEQLFITCAPVERLAILYMMNGLMRAHAQPTSEACKKLPSWYVKENLESPAAYSYAIHFFCWPGVRARFVKSQHRYCSNVFWYLFSKNFKLLWPYELRDCYARNTQTGQLQVSPMFKDRLGELRAWTMGKEFFQMWPELRADMAGAQDIPMKIDDKEELHDRRRLIACKV